MKLVDQLRQFMVDRGFELHPETLPSGIDPVVWGFSPGRVFDDYLFVFGTTDELQRRHQLARKFVNSRYRLPRALRMHHPHLMSLAVDDGLSEELEKWVQWAPCRTILSGEMCHVLVVDRLGHRVVHQAAVAVVQQRQLQMYRHVELGEAILELVRQP
ncbi:MAG: hypothetical protein HN348_10975 [Proteobacteria bacterium]|nr:hypothetical protein [Pseudomonadota bacterium]